MGCGIFLLSANHGAPFMPTESNQLLLKNLCRNSELCIKYTDIKIHCIVLANFMKFFTPFLLEMGKFRRGISRGHSRVARRTGTLGSLVRRWTIPIWRSIPFSSLVTCRSICPGWPALWFCWAVRCSDWPGPWTFCPFRRPRPGWGAPGGFGWRSRAWLVDCGRPKATRWGNRGSAHRLSTASAENRTYDQRSRFCLRFDQSQTRT